MTTASPASPAPSGLPPLKKLDTTGKPPIDKRNALSAFEHPPALMTPTSKASRRSNGRRKLTKAERIVERARRAALSTPSSIGSKVQQPMSPLSVSSMSSTTTAMEDIAWRYQSKRLAMSLATASPQSPSAGFWNSRVSSVKEGQDFQPVKFEEIEPVPGAIPTPTPLDGPVTSIDGKEGHNRRFRSDGLHELTRSASKYSTIYASDKTDPLSRFFIYALWEIVLVSLLIIGFLSREGYFSNEAIRSSIGPDHVLLALTFAIFTAPLSFFSI